MEKCNSLHSSRFSRFSHSFPWSEKGNFKIMRLQSLLPALAIKYPAFIHHLKMKMFDSEGKNFSLNLHRKFKLSFRAYVWVVVCMLLITLWLHFYVLLKEKTQTYFYPQSQQIPKCRRRRLWIGFFTPLSKDVDIDLLSLTPRKMEEIPATCPPG